MSKTHPCHLLFFIAEKREIMSEYVVYKHTCIINGKVYIGITNDINRRWRSSGIEYKPSKAENQNRPFWNAIQKHGWSGFRHEIIENNLTQSEACKKEKYYIKAYDSINKEKGYNVANGGNGGYIYKVHPRGMKGKHHSDEKKKAQSELMIKLNKAGKCGATWKNGHPKGMLGKHHSQEFKERLKAIPSDQHPSAKKIVAIMPNGTIKTYECVKYLKHDIRLDPKTIAELIRTGCKYELPKGNMPKGLLEYREALVGMKLTVMDGDFS